MLAIDHNKGLRVSISQAASRWLTHSLYSPTDYPLLESFYTFCPYTGDIFAIKTDDSKLKRNIYNIFKFYIHDCIFSFLVSTVFFSLYHFLLVFSKSFLRVAITA
jgi:hypothetical protein